MKVLRAEQYATVPWRNGGGTTREIAVYRDPSRHDDFLWRLSVATVAKSGPFSRFDGVDRTIAAIDGRGMALHAQASINMVTADAPPFAFPGEAEITCELVAGPTTDLNIMTRRGIFDHALRRERLLGWTTVVGAADETFVVANGFLELSSQGRASLRPLDTVAEISRGLECELYSERAVEIFIVEVMAA